MSYKSKIEEAENQLKIYREGYTDEIIDGKVVGENGAHLFINKRGKYKLLDLWVGFTSEKDRIFQRHLTIDHNEMIVLRNFLNKCLESYIEE